MIAALAELLGIDHHVTFPFCPWANGSVEVVGSDLLWTIRGVLSELRFAADEWDLPLSLVAYIINHRPRVVLGGRSAIEVMTGRKPDSAVKLAAWSGIRMKDAIEGTVEVAAIEKYCEALAESLERLHEEVRDKAEANRRRTALKEAKKGPGMRFNEGDFVVIPSQGNSPHPRKLFKVITGWQGPYEVVRAVNGSPSEFMLRLLGDTKEVPVHWRRMRRIAGPDLPMDEEVRLSAMHDVQRFVIDSFVDWAINTDGEVDLLVQWRGHEAEEERTWEPLEQLVEDVPVLVRKYVKQNGHHQLVAAHAQCVQALQAR